MAEKIAIGQELEARLEKRVAEIKSPPRHTEMYTPDELLIMDTLYCIRNLRRRDPMQVEAEDIIRRAAASIKARESPS